ncbi:hypothetical protein F4556_002629 [Kitasatospora gansuensis]|uniref:Uncharacterized protein n=1 Tax=Kitasatospora gansuensis TaxID=258050 RepID=A0A7W7SAX0_9ACTN|nr:hypothetical protein [Kitasatospora gansuensis]MBB4947094.1 hypothetical protein [Kitasatospora gansuensis]
MVLETIAFVLIGLAVGSGALVLLPAYFPAARSLTLATAVVAALIGGGISGYALDDHLPALALLFSAITSALLVSVLARPDLLTGTGRHRHA